MLNGKTIPNWVNRAASIGSWFSFLAPAEVTSSDQRFYEEKDSPSTTIQNIEISNFDCLNCKNPKELFTKNVWIESKSDEQMIIFLEFKTPVNLKCINFETKGDESSPKILKFFINKLNLDFENIERTKEVDIKVLENEEKIQIALKTVKFKKVSNFTVKCFFLFL